MPLNLDWRDATVQHIGVRLVGKYIAKPFLQVFMKLPFDGIVVLHLRNQPTEKELPRFVGDILVGIYRTCLWAKANQEVLRARFQPVVEAGQNSDAHMSLDRYFLAERTLEDDPNISAEEQERLLSPLGERMTAWNNLRSETLRRALDELGYGWPQAFQVLSHLAPSFVPQLAASSDD